MNNMLGLIAFIVIVGVVIYFTGAWKKPFNKIKGKIKK